MRLKRMAALLLCLMLSCSLLILPADAAEPGIYTAPIITEYRNPDTGEVDDGGSADEALGDGMCRSATHTSGLLEVDGDGNVWLTVRLLLQSNCSNVKFYLRTGNNTYSAVSYEVMAEDSGNDSIDYRIPVWSEYSTLKCSMYVDPMGRDVVWYLYPNGNQLTAGSEDFVVSIDPVEPKPTQQPEEIPTEEPTQAATEDPAEASTEAATSATVPAVTEEVTEVPTETAAMETESQTTESTAVTETGVPEETEAATEASGAGEASSEPAETPSETGEGPQSEDASETGKTSPVLWIVLVAAAGILVVVVILRNRRKK